MLQNSWKYATIEVTLIKAFEWASLFCFATKRDKSSCCNLQHIY